MLTRYTVFRPGEAPETDEIDLPEAPNLVDLGEVLAPVFPGARLERVAVLHDGKRADMFVDENGHAKGLPDNAEASAVYQAFARSKGMRNDHMIAGAAVLFHRPVWF